ncbi:MAG: phosphatase PAP2 family protein [Rickettsiales bacterium]
MKYKYLKLIIAIFLVSSLPINSVYAKSSLTTAGDILQIAIPVTALGVSYLKDDTEGEKQFIKSFVVTTGLTHALKFALKDTQLDKRPNGGHYSFPSGHSASAFQGAFFLQQRYGIEYGAPAIALAGLTGYSRVKGDYHHWRDVIGGTILAYAVNYFMVSKYEVKNMIVHFDKETAMLDFKYQF